MTIGIHVLGEGCGETVIIELPDGSVGVVDTYCHSIGDFPALTFLQDSLKVSSLRFVAASHPHSDHCRGITRLGEELHAEGCWLFDAISDQNLREYFYQLKKLGGRDAVDDALRLPYGTISLEVMRLNAYFKRKLHQSPPSDLRLMRVPERFDICGGEVTVTVLAPGTRSSTKYKDSIEAALTSMSKDGKTISPDWSGGRMRPNLISASLLFQYGDTRIILMGDTETPLWEEWNAERVTRKALNTGAVQFLKVGHHGSEIAYHQPFYASACQRNTIAVLTPFARHESPLPSHAGIAKIMHHTRKIYCTNRFAASSSTGYDWRTVSSPAIPASWYSAIAHKPSLERLLAPTLSRKTRPSPSDRIPALWVDDCKRRPSLLRLLHPRLRQLSTMIVRLPPQDIFRVSFFFEKDGTEIVNKRYLGSGTGKLLLP
jgi:hypothetical protein